MDFRIELRKKDFKKTFTDPRRKREEQLVQIRKQKREEIIESKRQQALASSDNHTFIGSSKTESEDASRASMVTRMSGPITEIPQISQLVVAINSSNELEQLSACQYFRRLLSIEKMPPIQDVIDAGMVPKFVEFLKNDNRPELQFEAAWALTNIASGTSEQTRIVIEEGGLPLFVRLLSSPKIDIREQAVWALGNIAGDCPALRDAVYANGGLPPLLQQLVEALETPRTKLSMLRNATWSLSNLCRGRPKPQLEKILPALPVLRDLLFSDDADVLTDACWALSYLTDGNDLHSKGFNEAILGYGFAGRIVQLMVHEQPPVQTAALRVVGNIVSGTEQETQAMISVNCVPVLRALLGSPKKILQKEACWTVSNITAGTPEQIQEVINHELIPILVKLACPRTTEYEIRKEAYWALANAASGAVESQIPYLIEAKIISPLSNILIENADPKLVESALEGIQNILKAGKTLQGDSDVNPYAVLFEEARAFPAFEQLQFQPPHSRIYNLVMNIMTKYMPIDDTCEDFLEDVDDMPDNVKEFAFQDGTMY